MAKITLTMPQVFEVHYLQLSVEPRYWEDAEVNRVEDTDGKLIPFRMGDVWSPTIIIDKGLIWNWPIGTTAEVRYKVADAGSYQLLNLAFQPILTTKDIYVPKCLSPMGDHDGDYINMRIDENGRIENWKWSDDEFIEYYNRWNDN